MKHLTRWLVLLVALAMVVAACAQDGDDGDAGDTTTTEADGGEDTTTTEGDGGEETTTTEGDGDMMDVTFDGVTVTEDTINIGMLADLSGVFATLVKDIVDAQLYTFDAYNEAGGVAGQWQINAIVEDTGYDVTVHGEKYAELVDQVVAFTQSTGSPHTASIAAQLEEDNRFAIPLSWYSGWADPELGANVLEQGITYCLEGINMVEFLAEELEAETGETPTIAIVSLPGEYGQDGAAGARIAQEALGLELVYDGEGQLGGEGNTEVIQALVEAQPDIVHITSTPGINAEVFGGTTQQGLTEAQWIGTGPSFNFALFDTPLGPEYLERYTQSVYYAPYGSDVERMDELEEIMLAADPDRLMTDAFSRGWVEAQIMIAVLEAAAASGDLTPEGVTAAAKSIEALDFGGISPAQSWAGEPDDFLVREVTIARGNPDYVQGTIAEGAEDPNVGRPFIVIDEAYSGDLVQEFTWDGPCFVAEG